MTCNHKYEHCAKHKHKLSKQNKSMSSAKVTWATKSCPCFSSHSISSHPPFVLWSSVVKNSVLPFLWESKRVRLALAWLSLRGHLHKVELFLTFPCSAAVRLFIFCSSAGGTGLRPHSQWIAGYRCPSFWVHMCERPVMDHYWKCLVCIWPAEGKSPTIVV